ncbi:GntR family transcriptional regulator [Streptomyces qinglanensis]|uniref:GntR family transcriptional regulator n=1 Tax=Streptomyces qinglanensis TaxID=943816 RepID=A0A1H9WUE8_9ACTN|nr:GntR family transcriptional regulator [Streptomyces qinglanensis]SES37570.1 GntR family transcriptional regulator [Streptomyces qinglanensis]
MSESARGGRRRTTGRTPSQRGGARHERIADELRRAIADGHYPVGATLPSEAELATAHGASRGTVRQAVSALLAEGLIGSRQGARRVVLSTTPSQTFTELRSFAQWARAGGRTAGGLVVASDWDTARPEEAGLLQVPHGAPVLRVLRVRTLDGEPVLLERTVYAEWIGTAVDGLPADCESVTQRLHDDSGLVFAHGEHHIDAVAAGTADAEHLGVRRGSPLLRVRRTTTTADGRPVETSDDRYRPGSVVFTVRNSTQTNPLARTRA